MRTFCGLFGGRFKMISFQIYLTLDACIHMSKHMLNKLQSGIINIYIYIFYIYVFPVTILLASVQLSSNR